MVALAQPFHRMEKAQKTGLSLPTTLRAKAIERSLVRHRGNFSAYVQDLLKADLAQEPISTAASPTILTDLARTYSGAATAAKLTDQLSAAAIDQPDLVDHLMRQLREYLACGGSVKDLRLASASRVSFHPLPEYLRKDEAHLTDQDISDLEHHTGEIVRRHHAKKSPIQYPNQPDDTALAAETAAKKRKVG